MLLPTMLLTRKNVELKKTKLILIYENIEIKTK